MVLVRKHCDLHGPYTDNVCPECMKKILTENPPKKSLREKMQELEDLVNTLQDKFQDKA